MASSLPVTPPAPPRPRYSFEFWQYNYLGQPCLVFDDLAAEPFLRWSIYAQRLLANGWLDYRQVSPAKWRIGIVWDCSLSFPNALKYILCAINRSNHSDRITIEPPDNFIFRVQVHEAALRLDVEAIKGTTFAAICATLKDRLLFPAELATIYCCVSPHDPNLYNLALNLTAERLRRRRTTFPRDAYLRSVADRRITGRYAEHVWQGLVAAIERSASTKKSKNSCRHGREVGDKRSRASPPAATEQVEEAATSSPEDGQTDFGDVVERDDDLEGWPTAPSSEQGPWDLQNHTRTPGSECSETWTI